MTSFDDEFQRSTLAVHPHERRGGGSQPTRMVRLDSPAHESVDPATSDLVVALILQGRGGAEWAWDGAKSNHTSNRRAGTLGVTPVGARGRFEVAGFSSVLIVAARFESMAKRLEPDVKLKRDLGLLHDAYTDQPVARGLCLRLWRAAAHPGSVSDLTIDALSEHLFVALAGSDERQSGTPSLATFSPFEQRRLSSAAEHPNACVSDLAGAVAMPVRTFRRRFIASFGMPPHKWLIRKRILQARTLLIRREHSLSELALDLGFANQAHFSDVFRRESGVSPGRFRRENANEVQRTAFE